MLRWIRPFVLLACCTAVGLAQEAGAQPDKMVLKNGSALQGRITAITGAKVTIDVPGLGTVQVAWPDIETLATDKPLLLGTTDDARFDAVVKGRSGEQLELTVDGAPRQVPIEQFEEVVGGREGVVWNGLISVGIGATTGNTDRRSANANMDVTRRTEDDRANLKLRWFTDRVKDANYDWVTNDRYASGFLRYDRFISSRLFWFARAGLESDHNANLDLRFIGDAGLGYQLLDEAAVKYSVQVGVGYVSERYSTAGSDDDYAVATLSHNLTWNIVDGLAFLHDAGVSQSLESPDDVLVKADTRLRWTMIKDMFTELQWLLDYDNTPATGADRVDQRYFLNVGWTF
jgi:putative salt-induced outer membrane protein YdiY